MPKKEKYHKLKVKEPQAKTQAKSNVSNNVYNIDKAILINGQNYFNNGGFFTGFAKAFLEIATNKELNKLDLKLLILLVSYMGEKEMMLSANRQRLLTTTQYALVLSSHRSKISPALQNLEREGYIKKNKTTRELEIIINPDMAYNGRTKEFTTIWNQMAIDFGLKPRKEEDKPPEEEQDWDSHLLEDIRKANDSLDELT